MLTITTDSHSHDIHGARYACPWRHPVSGRPCRNHIGERGGEQRRALALGLLILRAQRREARAIQLAVDEHARRYRRDEAHRRLSEGLGRGWC